MKFKLLLFLNSILLIQFAKGSAEREGRILVNSPRNDYDAQPSIEQQVVEEYSSPNATDASLDDIIEAIIDSNRQGRNVEGLDDFYSDPIVKQALTNGDDTQARNLIRDKLCSLGLMQCDEVIGKRPYPTRYYNQPPPNAIYSARPPPGYRPPSPQPPKGTYGPARPVQVPNTLQQQPPRKIGYAPSNNIQNFQSSKPQQGSIYEKYSTDFYEVDQAPAGIKFGYTEKPTITVVNQGKREASGVTQNHHVHHHYVHVDGSAPLQGAGLIDGTKTVLVNTPISEYSAANGLSSYQTSGFGASGSSASGFSPVDPNFEYKGVNSGSQGIYGVTSNVKPVFEASQYGSGASGASYFNQQNQIPTQNAGPAVFTDGSNGIYNGNVGSSYHATAPDFYKKELNINGGNRGNGLSSSNYLSQQQQQQNYIASQSAQKYSKNQYNLGEQYQGFESARQDQFDCVCVPFEQCPATDVVGRRDDLILPVDPRNLATDIEAETDGNSTRVVKAAEDFSNSTISEAHKISKRQVEGEQSLPVQPPGMFEGSNTVSFPTSRRRRDTDQIVPTSIEPKEILESLNVDTDSAEKDSEGRALNAGKRQAYYQRPNQQQKQCGPRAVCCRKPYRPNVQQQQQQPTQQFNNFNLQQQQLQQQQQQQFNYNQPQQQQINYNKCGTRNAQGINGRVKNPVYIDGDSEFGEYPWQAAILKKDPKESVFVCGGTLIDNQHIITAAHCVKTYSGFDLRVRLGEWDVNHDVEFFPYVERDVISVHVHPDYYAGTLDNDMALLKLSQPVDFTGNPHISPACLPDKFSDFTGQRCWTTGWGKDAWDNGKYQNILKEVDVPVINHQQCQNQLRQTRLGYNYNLNPWWLCAGGEENKDACKGDGGGPLVCEKQGVWQVAGIVSWGIGCGNLNVPGVYVKVSHYLSWIQQITGRY